jgi:phage-related baseplate assembly protein
VEFSTAPVLDYLGQLVGVNRLASAPALCTNLFTLVSGHGSVVIPAGIRVATVDGAAVFQTRTATPVDSLIDEVEIEMECLAAGTAGNGYIAGKVNVILDPLAYVDTSANIGTTIGGSEEETDEALRERIRLAPASFSTAGSRGAYIYHARTAHPTIIDVAVDSPTPGLVRIFPLVEGGIDTPQQILDAVELVCSGEKVRPLTDTVQVLTPTKIDYQILVELTLLTDNPTPNAESEALANLQAFVAERQAKLGRDVTLNAIITRSMVEGVYNVNIVSPGADLIIAENEYGNCTSVAVSVVGLNNG